MYIYMIMINLKIIHLCIILYIIEYRMAGKFQRTKSCYRSFHAYHKFCESVDLVSNMLYIRQISVSFKLATDESVSDIHTRSEVREAPIAGTEPQKIEWTVFLFVDKIFQLIIWHMLSIHVALHVMLQNYTNFANTSMRESLALINSLPTTSRSLLSGTHCRLELVGASVLLSAMWYI